MTFLQIHFPLKLSLFYPPPTLQEKALATFVRMPRWV